MTSSMVRPSPAAWYRERWPWLLIAGPAIVVIASFTTLWLAVATDDGVIADDYYKRGLLINQDLDRTLRAEALHVAARLRVSPEGTATLALTGLAESAAPAAIRVHLAHPTRAGQDRVVTLTRGRDGDYVGTFAPRPEGRWLVTIETEGWKLPTVAVVDGLADVRTPSSQR